MDKKGYIIQKITDDNYLLCRIIKEYNKKDDAKKDLIQILSKKINEKDLLK